MHNQGITTMRLRSIIDESGDDNCGGTVTSRLVEGRFLFKNCVPSRALIGMLIPQ